VNLEKKMRDKRRVGEEGTTDEELIINDKGGRVGVSSQAERGVKSGGRRGDLGKKNKTKGRGLIEKA